MHKLAIKNDTHKLDIKTTRTLGIIKPDAIKRRLFGQIIARIEKSGLKIVNIKMGRMSKKVARKFYFHIKKKDKVIYNQLIDFISSSKLIFLLIEGKNAARKLRKIVGATDPSKAKKGTIRRDFGIDSIEKADRNERSVYNLIHATDEEKAEKEVKLFF